LRQTASMGGTAVNGLNFFTETVVEAMIRLQEPQ
jgi:hypothetical protein